MSRRLVVMALIALVACTSSSKGPTRELAEPVAPPAGNDFTHPDARVIEPRMTDIYLIVFVGRLPTNGICNRPALSWRTVVKLREPVGRRSIVDGSTGKIVWAAP